MFFVQSRHMIETTRPRTELVIHRQLLADIVMCGLQKFWLNEAPPGAVE